MQVYKKVTFLYGGRLIKAAVYDNDRKGWIGLCSSRWNVYVENKKIRYKDTS